MLLMVGPTKIGTHVICGGTLLVDDDWLICDSCGKLLPLKGPSAYFYRPPSAPETNSAAQGVQLDQAERSETHSAACVGAWNPSTKGWNCRCGAHWHKVMERCPTCGDMRPAPRNP